MSIHLCWENQGQAATGKRFSLKVQRSPLVNIKVRERLTAPALLAKALQAALHQERAQLEVLLTDPVALVVLLLLGQVFSTARHLRATLVVSYCLQLGGTSQAKLGTCSWPTQELDDNLL